MNKTLPKGWVSCTFGDLGSWVGGGTPNKSVERYWNGGSIPWISPKDMKREHISNATDWITSEAVEHSATRLLPANVLLVVTRSGILEHSLPVAITDIPVAINQDIKALLPCDHVIPYFALLAMKTYAREILRECSKSGTTVANINMERLLTFPLPLPPLSEQRRIVARIEALFSCTGRIRADLERITPLIKYYRQRTLEKIFEDASVSYDPSPFGTYIAAIESGKNLRCEERLPKLGERGIVKISAVTWGKFDSKKIKTAPADVQLDPRNRISEGDFLISRANTLELVGAPAIALGVPPETYLSDKVLRLRFHEPIADWALWFLRSPRGRREIEARSNGNQLSMRNIGQAAIREIPIPMPDIATRRTLITSIEKQQAASIHLEHEASRALALLDNLEQSILAKAFRGELVSQDSVDEQAEKFLDSVRNIVPKLQRPTNSSKSKAAQFA